MRARSTRAGSRPGVRAALSLVLLLGLVCVLEGGARFAGGPPDFFAADPGRVLLPAHRYLLWVNAPGEREEQGVPVRINRLGLRGPEPEIPKPPGTRRLLVTGDSVVYGFGVPEEALFTHVAAAHLGVEGWTAAVPGYSTAQSLNLLDMTALSLEPDVVVIANLWSDLSVMGFADRDVLDAYAAGGPGARWGAASAWLGARSALFRQIRHATRGSDAAADERVLQWRARPTEGASGRRVPIAEYATNLAHMVRRCRDAGAEVAFLNLPIRATVQGHAPGGTEAAYAAVMADTAQRLGSPLVDGAAALRAAQATEAALWQDATHLSARGHAVVGARLAADLAAWAGGAALERAPSGTPPRVILDPDPTPSAEARMKVPDDMIP
jgi:lysophospholipase L1-like esterase